MSRFIAYTLAYKGHIYPIIPTLLELKARGHEVLLATGASELAGPEKAGIPVRAAVEETELKREDWREKNPFKGFKRNSRIMQRQLEPTADDLARIIEEHRPDALVLDPMATGAKIAAEAAGLPWADIAASPVFIPTDPPWPGGLGLAPARGPLARLRDRLLLAVLRRILGQSLPPVNRARADRGLEPLEDPLRLVLGGPMVLGFTAEPFEDARDNWSPAARLIGASVWEPEGELPAWFAEEDDRPLILVVTSSLYQQDEKLVRTAFDAFADQPVRVVATMPSGELPEDVPANARVERFLPHSKVMPHTACAICHGGMGTTGKALASGVPVVAVPFGRDQRDVAARLERSGSGVSLLPAKLTPERLRSAVEEARRRRPGAERVAEGFRQAGGARAAADALEELASGKTR